MGARAGIASLVMGLLALTSCGGAPSDPQSAASSVPGSDRFPVPAVNTVDPRHPSGCTTWPLVSMREVRVPDSSQHAVAYTYRNPRAPTDLVEQHRPLARKSVNPLSMTRRQLRFFDLDPRPPVGVLRNLWRRHYAAGTSFGPLGLCTYGVDYISMAGPSYPVCVCGSPLQYSGYTVADKHLVTRLRPGRHRTLHLTAYPYVWVSVLTTYSCSTGPTVSVSPRRCFDIPSRVRARDGHPVGLLIHGGCSFSVRLDGRTALHVVVQSPTGRVLTHPLR